MTLNELLPNSDQRSHESVDSTGADSHLPGDERYRLIIESVRDYAIFMLDAEGHVRTWNEGARLAKGYEAREIVGKHISVFYPPEEAAARRPEHLLKRAEQEGRVEDEGWRVRKDGSRFWADVVITALRGSDRKLLGFCKVTRDLTERKRAEENARRLAEVQGARAASESSLKAMRFLVDASKALSATLDFQTVLEVVARLVVPALADNCVVDVLQADGKVRRVAEHARDPAKERVLRELRRFPPGAGRHSPVMDVLRTGKTVFLPEFDATALQRVSAGEEYTRLVREIAPRSSVTVPLRSRDRVLGAITFGMAESGRTYSERDLELAEELGRRAGAALDNANLYRAQLLATERTERLLQTTAALAQVGSLDEAGRIVIEQARDTFGAAAASVHFVEPQEGRLQCVAAVEGEPQLLPPGATLGAVLEQERPLYLGTQRAIIERFAELKGISPPMTTQALMLLALRVEGEAIGAFAVAFSEPRVFSEQDRQFAESLAHQCAQCIDRVRLHLAERAARRDSSILYRLSEAVSRADSLEEVLSAALDPFTEALGAPRSAILLAGTDGKMRFRASRGVSEICREAMEGHCPWEPDAAGAEPLLVESAESDERVAPYAQAVEADRIGALGFFPLIASGRLIGMFLACYPDRHRFTDAERRVGSAIASHLAFAVEKKSAQEDRERFLGIVGHDLRNPLSAIAMSANALLLKHLGESVDKPAHRIAASAVRMERLISQLLTFAQARQGHGVPLHPSDIDLGEVARRVVDELKAAHPDHSIHLFASGDLGGFWDGDRLAEVLSNLVGNAIEHGEDSPVLVRITDEGASVSVEVANRGPVIAQDVLPTLFEPFRQGGGAKRVRVASVGLGLYISRELVQAHGGTIGARSAESDGTVFWFSLPRRVLVAFERPQEPIPSDSLPTAPT